MEFIYNMLAKKHGDGQKAKGIYRTVKCIVSAVLGIGIGAALSLVSHFKLGDNLVWYAVAAIIVGYAIFVIISALRDPMYTLHASPDFKEVARIVEKHSAFKLDAKDPCGKNIAVITLANDAVIEMKYEDLCYRLTVKNDEWDAVETFTAENGEELYSALDSAASCAAALEKAPEGEYDDTAAETDEEEYAEGEEEYTEGEEEYSEDEEYTGEESE